MLFTETALGWNARENGLALAVSGLLTALVSAFLVGRAVSAWGERRTVMVGLVFGLAEFLTLALTHSAALLYLSLVVGALGGMSQPAIQSYVSRQISDTEQGQVQGAITSLSSLVGIAGPLLATSVFAAFTMPGAAVYFPGGVFLLGAALQVLGLILVRRAFQKNAALSARFSPPPSS